MTMNISKLIKGFLLSLAVLFLSSCGDKKSELKLQNVKSINLHIVEFKIISTEHEKLQNVFFSIENSEEGCITNKEALPFGTKLKDINFQIKTEVEQARIQIALKKDQFKPYRGEEKYTIDLNKKTPIYIKVSDQGKSYTYQVKIKTYLHHPATIEWTEINPSINPRPSKDGTYRLFSMGTKGSEETILMTHHTSPNKNQFFSLTESKISEKNFPQANQVFTQIKAYQDEVFALAQNKSIYHYSKGKDKWEEVKDIKALALLGVFAPRTKGASNNIALVVEQNGVKHFACYNEAQGLRLGAKCPQDFPYEKQYTFSSFNQEVGAELRIIGLENNLVSTYTSTNGLDWAEISSQLKAGIHTVEAVLLDDTFFRFDFTSKGLEISSLDKGRQLWKVCTEYALSSQGKTIKAEQFINSKPIIWTKGLGEVFLYDGKQNKMYKGLLKKYEQN